MLAAKPGFKNWIDSNETKLILNDNEKFLDKEVPMTSEEGCTLLPVSQGIISDDIHLLNNVESEGN